MVEVVLLIRGLHAAPNRLALSASATHTSHPQYPKRRRPTPATAPNTCPRRRNPPPRPPTPPTSRDLASRLQPRPRRRLPLHSVRELRWFLTPQPAGGLRPRNSRLLTLKLRL